MYGGGPGKPCHMAPLDVTVNQKARGCFHKNTWHMPTANLAIFYLALLLPPGQVKLCTPHGSQSIHRVAHGSHRFIVCHRVDAWSPPQAVCHQTWSPLQAGCHHHDTARFNTVQQIPTNRPYLALWGVINNPEPKPILGTPPTTWPSYALRCLPNPWAWGSG